MYFFSATWSFAIVKASDIGRERACTSNTSLAAIRNGESSKERSLEINSIRRGKQKSFSAPGKARAREPEKRASHESARRNRMRERKNIREGNLIRKSQLVSPATWALIELFSLKKYCVMREHMEKVGCVPLPAMDDTFIRDTCRDKRYVKALGDYLCNSLQ